MTGAPQPPQPYAHTHQLFAAAASVRWVGAVGCALAMTHAQLAGKRCHLVSPLWISGGGGAWVVKCYSCLNVIMHMYFLMAVCVV